MHTVALFAILKPRICINTVVTYFLLLMFKPHNRKLTIHLELICLIIQIRHNIVIQENFSKIIVYIFIGRSTFLFNMHLQYIGCLICLLVWRGGGGQNAEIKSITDLCGIAFYEPFCKFCYYIFVTINSSSRKKLLCNIFIEYFQYFSFSW